MDNGLWAYKLIFMKQLLLVSTLFFSLASYAQTPEDGLKTAWFTQNGTARSTAIGGVMASLGGDITAVIIKSFKTNSVIITC